MARRRSNPPPAEPLPADECAEKLKALSEPTRLRIIDRLRDGPATVSDIAAALDVELMLASHHLRLLRAAGFLDRRKRGRFAVYALRPGVADRRRINLGCCQLTLPREAR